MPTNAGKSLRARQRAFARAQFLEEGLRLFDERGYAQTTIEELASRCGCAKGTVYAHFPEGKDELVREIYASIGENFDRDFKTVLDDHPHDVFACVDAAAELLMDISAEPAKGRFFMISAPALPSVLGPKLGVTGRGIVSAIAQRIRAAQLAGTIDKSLDAKNVSQLILGMLRELGMCIAAGDATKPELRAALDALLTGALRGSTVSA